MTDELPQKQTNTKWKLVILSSAAERNLTVKQLVLVCNVNDGLHQRSWLQSDRVLQGALVGSWASLALLCRRLAPLRQQEGLPHCQTLKHTAALRR